MRGLNSVIKNVIDHSNRIDCEVVSPGVARRGS